MRIHLFGLGRVCKVSITQHIHSHGPRNYVPGSTMSCMTDLCPTRMEEGITVLGVFIGLLMA